MKKNLISLAGDAVAIAFLVGAEKYDYVALWRLSVVYWLSGMFMLFMVGMFLASGEAPRELVDKLGKDIERKLWLRRWPDLFVWLSYVACGWWICAGLQALTMLAFVSIKHGVSEIKATS